MHADYLGASFRNRGILGAKSGRCGHEVHRRRRLGRCSLRRILCGAIVSTSLSRVAGFALAREGGLVARSMYNFGFSDLRLVNPKLDWPSEKAHAVSVDAKSIIESAKVYSTLREALSDSTLSIAYTARKRDMSKQFTDNKSIIKEIHDEHNNDKLAVVFGGEASGLTNDHLSLVTRCVTIDTHENFSSLNLSHAVNVFCYSIFSLMYDDEKVVDENSLTRGNQNELMHFFDHIEKELENRGFFQPEEKMPKMKQNRRNIFHRADLSDREIATLRGVVTVLSDYRKTEEI